MSDDQNDPSNLGSGGGQMPLGPMASMEADEKAMRSGRGRMLAMMILSVVAAIVALVVYMAGGGDAEMYSQYGRNINGLRHAQFDGFWACALQGENIDDITDNTQLMAAIDTRAGNGRGAYARQVRDECMDKLAELESELQGLIPPPDLQEKTRELEASVAAGRGAWSDFIAHLEAIEEGQAYDSAGARDKITAIARSWYDYRRLHGQLNDGVREHLEN